MNSILRRIMDRFHFRYVGTVFAETYAVNDKGEMVAGTRQNGYWVLEESRSGRRRSTEIGDPGRSPNAQFKRAAVAAWVRGGPLPPLDERFRPGPPRGKLIAIDGSRGGAG